MKLMTPPGELLAKVDAEPPRTDSIRSNRPVGSQEDIRVAECDVTELEDRQSVLVQLQELRAPRGGRQTAHDDIGVAGIATAGLGTNARDIAEDLRCPARRVLGDSSTLIEFTEMLLRNSVVVPAEAVTTIVSNDVSAFGSVGVLPPPDCGSPACGEAVCAYPTDASTLIKTAVKTFLPWSMTSPFLLSA